MAILNFLFLQTAPPAANPLFQFLPILLIFGIFYFLLFLPMQKQKKQQKLMLAGLKNGDVVMTNGGILGTIVGLNDEDQTVVIRVKPDNIKLQIARSAVASVVAPESK